MNLKNACLALSRPLKFGDAEQIAAHQFLEKIMVAVAAALDCEAKNDVPSGHPFPNHHECCECVRAYEKDFEFEDEQAVKQLLHYGGLENYFRAKDLPISLPADLEEIERITGALQ